VKMSPKKIERLIRVLREQGVEYIKTPELEIRLSDRVSQPVVVRADAPAPLVAPAQAQRVHAAPEAPAAAVPPVENEIPHHENQVAKLLKLSDEDLVDALFPITTEAAG
jgi:hypothetical protein